MTDQTQPRAESGDITSSATGDATNRKFVPIDLEEPIKRGDTTIAKIILRKPGAGEMRGLSLQDLLTSDVTTILKLVPRISDPILTEHEANVLDPADLAQCGGAIRGFFLTAAERAMMEKMIAGPMSMN